MRRVLCLGHGTRIPGRRSQYRSLIYLGLRRRKTRRRHQIIIMPFISRNKKIQFLIWQMHTARLPCLLPEMLTFRRSILRVHLQPPCIHRRQHIPAQRRLTPPRKLKALHQDFAQRRQLFLTYCDSADGDHYDAHYHHMWGYRKDTLEPAERERAFFR